MYHLSSQLFTYHIQAIDREMGKIKDIYSDDTWKIRYIIADTRKWLPERKVLLPPAVVERIHTEDETVEVTIDKNTIKNSPPVPENSNLLEGNKDIAVGSLDWEWPNQVLVTSDLTKFKIPQEQQEEDKIPIQNEEELFTNNKQDLQLRSHREIVGARVHAEDGKLGKLLDFVYSEDWRVEFIILTGNDFTTSDFYVYPVEKINNIDWYEADVYLDETMKEFELRPVYTTKEEILAELK